MGNNTATNTATKDRFTTDFAYEKSMAESRNSKSVYAEFEAGFENKRVILWAVGGLSIEEVNGVKVYAGKLATSTMYLGKKKGYSSRGGIKPIPFVYNPATKTVHAMQNETPERKRYLATHVTRLMEKYLAGVNRLNQAKDIESLKSIKGYNMLRADSFETFLKSYRGITTSAAQFDTKAVADAVVASLPDLD